MMRLYRALLRLYPASFRAEYGGEMCAVFAQRRRSVSGALPTILLWANSIADLIFNAAAAHWDVLRQDLRYTARSLGRTPGFALTAVLVVALGVGANTAAFSVADFVLLRPLPFPEPDRLVKLWNRQPGYERIELSPPNYRDLKAASSSFEAIGAYHGTSINLVGQANPERLEAAAVTADLLPILGVQPAVGRLFTPAEAGEGAAGTVLLSWGLWQRRFGGDGGVLGQRILLDGTPHVVIGVMPREFLFPQRQIALWMPLQLRPQDFEDRTNNYLYAVGKLKPGVSLGDARAEMNVVAARLEQEYPVENKHVGANVNLLSDELPQQTRLLLLALCGAALCILLIACANLANLLLARAVARRKELSLRTALGAGRERLVRQLMTESVVLAVAGGSVGVLVAVATVPLLATLIPTTLPISEGPSLDLRVLLFAGLITGLTGVGFGVVPALRVCRDADFDGLREGNRSGGGRKQRLRSALVITEVMVSVVLLVSAGLLLRALWGLQAVDPGFRTENVLTLRTVLPLPKYDSTARRMDFYTRVLSEVRALPGVTSAAYISFLPMAMTGGIWPVIFNGEPAVREANRVASLRYTTPGFFTTLGIPLRRGREITEADRADSPYVAVVSESFARQFWPFTDPIGQRFEFALNERTVVGVVGDVRVRGLERTSEPQVYIPATQVADGSIVFYTPRDLVVRASTDPAALLPSIRQIVQRVDPEQPISDVRMLEEIVADQTAPRSVQALLLGVLAAVAFLLAGVGIHGLLSFTVSNRSQEIGVRMALGARPRDIVSMVMRQGVRLALAGVLPGVVLAYMSGRALQALLASVQPGDASTFVTVVGLCLLMTAVGCLFPTLRAVRVDPISAMRAE
ncbi:MAG: ABC transporter permease [Gemmatimonadales bacterium]|nr:ABC transporter permease [Gemmatimonadales bacterium]